MSITGALSNALSGLTAAARSAEVVSANVANALTEGYGRRSVILSSQSVGGTGAGVRIDGIRRDVDQVILSDRWLADAQAGHDDIGAAFYARMETTIGLPGDPNSLNGALAGFDAALIQATSRPDSDVMLTAVLNGATAVAGKFNAISDGIQAQRMLADDQIALNVDLLNNNLAKIAGLNHQIRLQQGAGHDAAGLMDQRQVLVDEIAPIIPLRVLNRDHGEIAIYSTGGASLLDGTAARFGFAKSGVIVPEMSLSSGGLSGLTLNGQTLNISGANGPISGGRLAGLFAQRDVLAPQAQSQIDALARDLVSRFQSSGLDTTLPVDAPGLFTDAGMVFAPANEVGLAGRLAVNAVVDPAAGGQLWRLRAGLGATAPGLTGDATLLNVFSTVLNENRIAATGNFAGSARSVAGQAAEVLSAIGLGRQRAESQQVFSQAQVASLKSTELAGGVDTDKELQTLLLVEQAYSANARVVSTIDEMIQSLLRI